MTTRVTRAQSVRVVIETGKRLVFASAVDWPGWVRSGKTEQAALAALADHAGRYAAVAAEAAVPFAPADYAVIQRVHGTATTDFGAPDSPADEEKERLSAADARRMASLVAAAWVVLDRVVDLAPASLRKGPRGGGRDRDAIAQHVLGAEHAYARRVGVRLPAPQHGDTEAISALRAAIMDALGSAQRGAPMAEGGWLPRYAARRVAWHALDHAWEIENRSQPDSGLPTRPG